jgi:hypothetical protein
MRLKHGAPPNKAMKPTDQGQCSQGLFEAMQKRSAMYRRWLGTVAACTDILPPRLIAGRWAAYNES